LAPAILRRDQRVTLALTVEHAEAFLSVDTERFALAPGAAQVSVKVAASGAPRSLEIRASQGVRIVALAVVDAQEDLPPPAPEPFVAPEAERQSP
jgi:hypothetical protein